jgi:hypothetical protein
MKEPINTISTSIGYARYPMSRWAEAPMRCSIGVKKLALKGTRAARCRPPRSGAWLRDNMASPNEASLHLRETLPLSRNNLHNHRRRQQTVERYSVIPLAVAGRRVKIVYAANGGGLKPRIYGLMGQRPNHEVLAIPNGCPDWLVLLPVQRFQQTTWLTLLTVGIPQRAGRVLKVIAA